MNLNINEIASAKIKEMHDNGEIKKRIEEGVQKSVFDAIDSSVRDYSFKRAIQEKVEKQLSDLASHLDFSAYTSFLKSKLEEMVSNYVKGDLAKEITTQFQKVYLNKPEQLTLSELLDAYKLWLNSELDEEEMYENSTFRIEQEHSYSSFIRFKCGIPESDGYLRNGKQKPFDFTFMYDRGDTKKGHIINASIDRSSVENSLRLGRITDFEAMVMSALFNETPIIIDIDVDEYDTYIYNED